MEKMRIAKELSPAILRVAISIVFLYFGFVQIYDPSSWTGYIPNFLTSLYISASNLVILNGTMEIILGTFLILGIYTRFSALILSIHLFLITFSLGSSPTAFRDFGLSFATLSIFLNGKDQYCLDNKF